MCDENTERDNEAWLSRRQLGVAGAAATVLTACGPRTPASSGPQASSEPDASGNEATTEPGSPAVSSRRVTIETPDGEADAVFVTSGSGPHPGVLMWPDIAGLRPAFETMAARLAGDGYAVLVVNPYYRSAKSPILTHFDEWRTEEGRARAAPMVQALSPDGIGRDGAAFVAWLDAQPEVDKTRKIGTQGYCMSGPFTFRVGAAVPDRVGAIASFHGGGLVTTAADSPHTLLAKMKAAALICIAENDHARQPEAKGALEQAAATAGRPAEIEVYPANHGWCALDSPVYDEVQADRAWSRLLATYAAHL